MRLSGRVIWTGVVALLAAWALAETIGWPIKTALYPRVVGIPLLVLATAETLLSLRGDEEPHQQESVDFTFSDEVPAAIATRRTAAVFAWIGGFYAAVILIGFPRAIPLFVFSYLRRGRETWIISLILPALAWLGFDALFVRLLHVPFADGLLWQWFVR